MAPMLLFAQDSTAVATAPQASGGVDLNTVLAIIALVLLIPVFFTGESFLMLVKHSLNRIKSVTDSTKSSGLLILTAGGGGLDWISYVLLTIILLEIVVIVYLSNHMKSLLKIEEDEAIATGTASPRRSLWDRLNSFRPMEDEAKLDVGHSYDGIRELDNVTPPWFTYTFLLSILFAIGYMYRYHVAKSAPLMIEEYKIEMAAADAEMESQSKGKANKIDENTVTMLGASDIEAGKKIFVEKCAACHAATGGSMPGGVGPNLTDDYWIHGGSLSNIFKSIKYGWPEKGMISWKDQIPPGQIAQIASFIKSIKGSNPANAKEAQGDLYKEEDAAATTTTTTTDSTKVDSLTKK
ncbi:MAG: c-type cytochrome [Saprospiraceae bacterium]|nr:c-type cytochrome [Saprospiraceae bacterium]